ncbi:hypothetical protein E2C01_089578 [Portunus trituberculatus]|uniref:Uncharacterized protein n=1 Tax=Portunus trituberculatus TaxID=210409 RepID=A0A5B7JCE4_PORTR|nr:hypothetical protein [Portunus trituberculatus]
MTAACSSTSLPR